MTAIQRILCPMDFSDGSRHAMDHALVLAKRFGATVTALHVVAPMPALLPYTDPLAYPPMIWTPESLDDLRREVARFVTDEGGGVPVESVCLEGNAAREILRRAEMLRADLVVMGTHGRSGFRRLLLGSITERVLRHATCPVLAVPPRAPDAVPLPSSLFARILVGVDFSACSLAALAYATSLASEVGARLKVVHVLEPVLQYAGAGVPGMDPRTEAELARTHLRAVIRDAVRGEREVSEVVTFGSPAQEMLAIAREERIDLIVTGVHGRNVADLLFFGSTTNRVVREATCPVLTVTC